MANTIMHRLYGVSASPASKFSNQELFGILGAVLKFETCPVCLHRKLLDLNQDILIKQSNDCEFVNVAITKIFQLNVGLFDVHLV